MRRRARSTNILWVPAALCGVLLVGCVGAAAFAQKSNAETPAVQQIKASAGAGDRMVVLDRVVAVVDGEAILASDVADEMQFSELESGGKAAADSPRTALGRVIDRTLIDKQRALQSGLTVVSEKDIQRSIEELRTRIPACANGECKTDAGWQSVLEKYGLTQAEVLQRIRERVTILRFLDLRFGVAVRVPNSAVEKYYNDTLVPQLKEKRAAIPPVRSVTARIREVLRQQQVDAMVNDWLKSLHGESEVRILDPAYGTVEDAE